MGDSLNRSNGSALDTEGSGSGQLPTGQGIDPQQSRAEFSTMGGIGGVFCGAMPQVVWPLEGRGTLHKCTKLQQMPQILEKMHRVWLNFRRNYRNSCAKLGVPAQ